MAQPFITLSPYADTGTAPTLNLTSLSGGESDAQTVTGYTGGAFIARDGHKQQYGEQLTLSAFADAGAARQPSRGGGLGGNNANRISNISWSPSDAINVGAEGHFNGGDVNGYDLWVGNGLRFSAHASQARRHVLVGMFIWGVFQITAQPSDGSLPAQTLTLEGIDAYFGGSNWAWWTCDFVTRTTCAMNFEIRCFGDSRDDDKTHGLCNIPFSVLGVPTPPARPRMFAQQMLLGGF